MQRINHILDYVCTGLLATTCFAVSPIYGQDNTFVNQEGGENNITKSVDLSTGVTLQYVEQGAPAGVSVLLLHGLSDSWHSFERVLPHLPESIHAFAITQRGTVIRAAPKKAIGPTILRWTWQHSWMLSSLRQLSL